MQDVLDDLLVSCEDLLLLFDIARVSEHRFVIGELTARSKEESQVAQHRVVQLVHLQLHLLYTLDSAVVKADEISELRAQWPHLEREVVRVVFVSHIRKGVINQQRCV